MSISDRINKRLSFFLKRKIAYYCTFFASDIPFDGLYMNSESTCYKYEDKIQKYNINGIVNSQGDKQGYHF